MAQLPEDPITQGGLASFAERFRRGELTSEAATRAYLKRIEVLDGQLGAFQCIAGQEALASARAVDSLRAAGTYLGLLMGVPIAIKDVFAVDGMPTTAGSKLDVDDLVGAEGPFVRRLRRAGCVILGKTKTVEFALGITGVSASQGTPRNPWDMRTVRVPGGSSSGSAVATSAGLCAFAIGSDTGGSVRVPAALCGVFGLKTTFGRWSVEGAFPLAHHLDSVGLLTRSARDAAIVFSVIEGGQPIVPARLDRLRLGKPERYFFEHLVGEVEARVGAALESLTAAGVRIEPADLPEAPEREAYFPKVLPASLIAILGRERFLANMDQIDPIIAERGKSGLDVRASEYISLELRRQNSMKTANARFEGFDAFITPSVAVLAPALADFNDRQKALDLALGMSRNSQPGNYLNLTGVNIPLCTEKGVLPVGLQLMGPSGSDARILALALAIEEALEINGSPSAAVQFQPRGLISSPV